MASAPLTGINSLPNETLSAIFSFLPIPDLARCAAVCERWHDIVTAFTELWKGKRYTCDRSPRECVEVYAVLRALPPIQEVVVKTGEFCIDVSYPRLLLTVSDVSDSVPAEDGPRLELCPNLRERGIFAQFLSEDRLDTSEGIGPLQVLDIECPWLKELTFLRRYSDVLQKLELKLCADLPSAAYAVLGQLGNLRRLFLCDSRVAVGDLEVAVKGMRRLASLRLEYCDLVSDLSCLRHCQRLRGLCVGASDRDAPLTGLRDLPAGLRSLSLEDVDAADELSEAVARLPLLEKLYLGFCKLAHLDCLRGCPRLRRLSLVFSHWPDTSQLSNLRHLARLEFLKLTAYRVDADVLSGALPSLTRLQTLLLTDTDVAHLRFLRHCPQLRTLSLYGTTGFEQEAYRELCHITNLQRLCISESVGEFVREVVRPYLRKVKIFCSWNFK